MGEDSILVFNAGSSSIKSELFDRRAERSRARFSVPIEESRNAADVVAAVAEVLARIDTAGIAVVGHRVVHGGPNFADPVRIDEEVRAAIADLNELAPLHNAFALAVIDAVSEAVPEVPQVAVFDTAFHATLPEEAYLYGVPFAWYGDCGIRRYGFHGISHQYCATRCAELLGRPLGELKLVTCHLGSGCSLAAISGGRSVATTMGFTPLDGLVMATRPGSLDPGILTWMLATGRIGLDELEATLQHRSGLLGLSGFSGDIRAVLARRDAGDRRAATAVNVYVFRLVQEIAAMTAALGGLDALVFAGGVGEHSDLVRGETCARLGWLGIAIDDERNAQIEPDGTISTPASRVPVLVIRTREELMIARECRAALDAGGGVPAAGVSGDIEHVRTPIEGQRDERR
jgi:acetate kinase